MNPFHGKLGRHASPLLTIGLAVTATVLTLAGAPARAQAGAATMRISTTSHCLDDARENFFKVQMWSCDSGSDEQWLDIYNSAARTDQFINVMSGLCLSAPAHGEGTMSLDYCAPSKLGQQWREFRSGVSSDGKLWTVWQNAASGFCLNTNSVGNGTVLTTAVCNANDLYQRWQRG
jgi:hypothetical protein